MPLNLLWFIIFITLLAYELLTVDLVSIWFVIGSLVALLLSFITDSLLIQTFSFLIVSIITLILTKPFVKKFKAFKVTPTNYDRVIGQVGDVTKKIERNKYGEVKIFGNVWTAYSSDGSEIDAGEKVVALRIEGVKLIVKKEN